jgi:hypothetical protein
MKPRGKKGPHPVELASQIDELIGRRHRSAFVEETAGRHIEGSSNTAPYKLLLKEPGA